MSWWVWPLMGLMVYAALQFWVGINEWLTGDWYEWRRRNKR